MEALAVHYRPTSFEEVCSQQSIIKILKRQIELKQLKNCYLFCGASGCGKTTVARIFANEINHYHGLPIEIDGASNNGVDNVKQIISSANERSLDGGVYKIYIIDECHMLTTQAWNAFLKCIEEPPTFTIFIFCTTDPQKIPDTIKNRVMRFNFNRLSSDIIKERLLYICKNEGFINYSDACDYISRICGGQMRDAIAYLEKCADFDIDLKLDNVLEALGNYSYSVFFELINYIIDGSIAGTLKIISDVYNQGGDLRLFIDQFLSFTLDLCKYSLSKDYRTTSLPSSFVDELNRAINFEGATSYYCYVMDKVLAIKNVLRNDNDPKSTIEVMLIGITRCQ